ncbi:prenyltransferase/squalene oxidase repeat-containing protein [Fontivita pretiosa]|uniref:prenyltransferase/squalene oxidase repeat-containing protein n=1 Tax=Fontivita pretiosa TaxID=2989684 RepID=UPI003D164384
MIKRLAMLVVLLGVAYARGADPALQRRLERAMESAGGYLLGRQSPDGAWHSGVHGSFRDGVGLTPHVMTTLYFLASEHPPAAESIERGLQFLLSITDEQGRLRPGFSQLNFPVYTSAEISWVLAMCDRMRHPAIERAWLSRLRERQLNAALGWNPQDAEFGGWGYSPLIPHKLPSGARGLMVDSNLSATVFALGALRVARVAHDDPAWRDALVFIDRCQNFQDDPGRHDDRYDDGGFFFMPADAARNKPGAVPGSGKPGAGERYHSYGTMTADGVRAMLVCGRRHDHPRVVAAARWLATNFDVTRNPGTFNTDREFLRDSSYYYWVWSASHAMTRLGLREIQTARGRIDWRVSLAEELLKRQRPDGSWANDASGLKEDDPLVATPFAAAALVVCYDGLYRGK